jgi:heme O synthase-like polyprenyltransferase
MKLKPESAKALAWTSGILMILALVIMSPTGAFALLVLAAVCAAIALAFGPNRLRIVFLALLVATALLAANFYPAFARERDAYMQRAKQRAAPDAQVKPSHGPRQ